MSDFEFWGAVDRDRGWDADQPVDVYGDQMDQYDRRGLLNVIVWLCSDEHRSPVLTLDEAGVERLAAALFDVVVVRGHRVRADKAVARAIIEALRDGGA